MGRGCGEEMGGGDRRREGWEKEERGRGLGVGGWGWAGGGGLGGRRERGVSMGKRGEGGLMGEEGLGVGGVADLECAETVQRVN